MSVLVSAYAASPAHARWDAAFEHEFLHRIAELPGVRGFELPWVGRLHPHDDEWLLRSLPADVELALTGLPHVVSQATAAPGYGLASPDEEGRQAALTDAAGLRDVAQRLTDTGHQVRVIELHTAPRRARGTTEALAASLTEVSGWDWGDAELVIEHCDADVGTHQPEKGFLTLDTEISAIAASGAPVGVWLNWGRSAIELRDAGAVETQVAEAAGSGLLRGLAFSGAASEVGDYGAPWADAHLPISAGPDDPSRSLLTPDRVYSAFAAAGAVAWLGVKVSRRPGEITPAAIADGIRTQIEIVEAAVAVAVN